MIKERWLFMKKFLENPKQVGSLTPSSVYLARSMAGAVQWNEVRAFAELGAGTGAITRCLDKMRYDDTAGYLFEKNPAMRRRLAEAYPHFRCHADALEMSELLRREGVPAFDCIFSGLPFFNFEQRLRDQLLSQVRQSLAPDGQFVAFQYSLQMRKQFARHFDVQALRFVPINFPPAFVYVCRRNPNRMEY
ncbi:class I SAM-dependent methyltransferase [Cohnella nanjingensis]|uniref:Phospholipid methyltransferase n=1 Tax=Cohnella nanjingensis TaxID=1387779 RepID=A0A7X0RXI2_9BACL|nr:phospholipid methyltransferase [Cohnella nanjingensis]MBB6673924.1 phospholipid methyltransferase [Cohnella nanjingensis]